MDQYGTDNLFGILKGDTVIDLQAYMLNLDQDIQKLSLKIRDNDWTNSRKASANQARKQLEQMYYYRNQCQELLKDIVKRNRLAVSDNFLYHEDLFREYNCTITVKKKQ